MKLVFDLQGAQAINSKRGIGRYSKAIVSEICSKFSHELDIHLMLNGAFLSEGLTLKNNFKALVPKANFHTFFPSTNKSEKLMYVVSLCLLAFINALFIHSLILSLLIAFNSGTLLKMSIDLL